MQFNRRFTLVLCSTLAFILVASYFFIGPPPQRGKIRIVAPPAIIASLPIWVAQEKGFFREASLDVEIVDITNSSLMVKALTTDNADIAPAVSLADLASSSGNVSNAMMDVRIFSHSRMRKNPAFDSILTLPTGNINSIANLEGKSISVYPGMTAELTLRNFLERSGVNTREIKFIKLPPPQHYSALMRDDVQAVYIYEPFRTATLENGKARELTSSIYADAYEPSTVGVSAISRKFIKSHGDLAKRFYKAWDKSIDYIRDNAVDSRRILAENLNIPISVATKATWVDATKVSELDFRSVNNTIQIFQKANAIPPGFVLEKDMFVSIK